MRRWSLAIFLFVSGFVLTAFWLVGTTPGACWVMGAISRWTPLQLQAQKISGQIGHRLLIEGLQLRWPKGRVQVGVLRLDWQPLHLLTGQVTVNELTLEGIHIWDDRPERKASPGFEWPSPPPSSLWIHGQVKALRVERLFYQKQYGDPSNVKRLTASLNWSYGFLTVEKLRLEWPWGHVQGAMELGLVRPSLHLQLHIFPSKMQDAIHSLTVNSRLLQTTGSEEMRGNVMIEGRSGSARQFMLESDIGLTKEALLIQNLVFSRPGWKGTCTGEGRLFFTADDLPVDLSIAFSKLDFSKEFGIGTELSGRIKIRGSPNRYTGEFQLENVRDRWYSGRLSGSFVGGLQQVQIRILTGSILEGDLQGNVNLQWGDGFSLSGALRARNLNPAMVTPDWAGMINLDVEAELHWPEQHASGGRLKATLHRSHVRGHPLTGDIELSLREQTVRLIRADLKGKGFSLLAEGLLQDKISFSADIDDFSGLIPSSRGSLMTKGWIVWRNKRLALHFDGRGKKLFLKGVALDAVDFSARLGEAEEAPLEIRMRFREMSYGSFSIHSAVFDVTGKLSHHQMIFSAHQRDGQVAAVLEGRYLSGEWHGVVVHLSGADSLGSWRLQAPSEIDLSFRKIRVKSLKIHSTIGETLELGGDLSLHPLRGNLRTQWRRLNLSRINLWLKRPLLGGHTTGDIFIQRLDEDRLRVSAQVSLTGNDTDGWASIGLSRGWAKLDWNEEGLSAFWEFKDAKQGRLWGRLSSPQPGQVAIPDRGRLELHLDAVDLSHFRSFLPRGVTLEGRLRGNFLGEWQDKVRRLSTIGELSISPGTVRWQQGKDEIVRDLQQAEASWMWHGDRLRGSLLLKLEDMGFLRTRFDIPLEAFWPISLQRKGVIRVLIEGRVQDEGLVSTLLPDLLYESHGKIEFEANADGTWEVPRLSGKVRLSEAKIRLPVDRGRPGPKELLQSVGDPDGYRMWKVELDHGLVKFHWNEERLQATGELDLAAGGKIRVTLFAPQPVRMALPEKVKIDAQWESIDLHIFRPWLPRKLVLDGKLSGSLSAHWSQGSRFDHVGEIKISQASIQSREMEGRVVAPLQALDISWIWQSEALRGRFSLAIAGGSTFTGSFLLPVAPRYPVTMKHRDPLQLSLRGHFRERGWLAAFFPDVVQKSLAQMDLELRVDGTWAQPHVKGLLRLKEVELSLLANRSGTQTIQGSGSNLPLKLELTEGLIQWDWDEKGLLSSSHLDFATGAQFRVTLFSSESARMGLPMSGAVQATWKGMEAGWFTPWLSSQLVFKGQLSGRFSGQWSNGRFDTVGEATLSQGEVRWNRREGSASAMVQKANLAWNWKNNYLWGELTLILADAGQAKGQFRLPLPARFPVAIHSTGPVEFSLDGRLEEKGLLPAFFPGIIQESRGQIHVALRGDGTWKDPKVNGVVTLKKSGAYLPGVGIRLEEFSLEAKFQGHEIRVTSFRTRSGPGQIEGDATIRIAQWKISHYHGNLKGERFQIVYLPELQILSDPRLEFQGTPEKLWVKGEIILSEVLITGPPTREMVRASSDVVIVDAPEVPEATFPLSLHMQVRLLLGEKVYCRVGGLEARLKGDLGVQLEDPRKMTVSGEIGVAQGHYDFYGHRLDIIRGRLWFAGGSVDSPAIDALAVRKIEEVQAGITVTGSLRKPIVKLYSRPAMAETDILSYIVLGQPLGKGTEQIPALAQAAGALLSAGQSIMLQGQLRQFFGVDTLDITAPPGESEVSRSIVTIGKYLTPKLYVSLGRSLFSEATLITFRYTLSKRLEIETTTGTESGATLYYRVEFR